MGGLSDLVGGGTLRLLLHFLLHPERRLHFRALREHTGLGTGALQREVARLESLGLVTRTEEDGRVYFAAVGDHPSWAALRTLVREHAEPAEVVREALRDVPGIRAAFLFGSSVQGTARADSDVDVLIVEDGMPLAAIGRATNAAQSLLQRAVDVKRYTPTSLAAKLARGSRFLRGALAGPKTWLIGSEHSLMDTVAHPREHR
jgi:predicted nucleotidyltransferase